MTWQNGWALLEPLSRREWKFVSAYLSGKLLCLWNAKTIETVQRGQYQICITFGQIQAFISHSCHCSLVWTIVSPFKQKWIDSSNGNASYTHFPKMFVGNIVSLLWQKIAVGKIFLFVHGPNWKNNMAIRSHWAQCIEQIVSREFSCGLVSCVKTRHFRWNLNKSTNKKAWILFYQFGQIFMQTTYLN